MSALHGHLFDPGILLVRNEFENEDDLEELDDDLDDDDLDDDDLDDDLDDDDLDDDDLDFDDDPDDEDFEAEYEELYEDEDSYTSRRRRSSDWE